MGCTEVVNRRPWADRIAFAWIESADLDPEYLAGSPDAEAREAVKILTANIGSRRNLTLNAGFWKAGFAQHFAIPSTSQPLSNQGTATDTAFDI
ncbi:hypothetical protein [Blastomonas sp. CACIA14H2]|uniref:hypothetical protein n=1 Tax=Blastomonas sp. CACIA14H2 TaxID=1419876 RepID=UPI004059C0B6